MTHEPECWFGQHGQDFAVEACPECPRLRAAYQRGREDAAKAVERYTDGFALIAAARGDGEQA